MQIRQRLMTDAQYYRFCMTIPDLRVERTSEGDILIMPPGGAETSWRNSDLTMQLGNWAREDGRGVVFDSSAEYFLPSGASGYVLGADAASISTRFGNTSLPITSKPPIAGPENCSMRLKPSGIRLGWATSGKTSPLVRSCSGPSAHRDRSCDPGITRHPCLPAPARSPARKRMIPFNRRKIGPDTMKTRGISYDGGRAAR
jgi:hypothetical protein